MSTRLRSLLSGVAGAAGVIAILTIASRVLGFGRWMAQATGVGPTAVGDAYATANLLPNVLFEVLAGGALAGVVVPVLAVPIGRRLRDHVDAISSALLTWTLLVLVPVGVLVAVLARPIAGALPLPDGADPAVFTDLTATFLTIFSPQIPLYGVGVVLTGVLQAHRRFLAPAVVPIASTLVVIATYLVFGALAGHLHDDPSRLPDLAVGVLAWGTTAGVVALSLPLLLPVRHAGVRLRWQLRFPAGVTRRLWALAAAGVGGVIAQQLAAVAMMVLARRGGVEGTFNVFQYTQAVYLLPYAVLAVPLVTVFQPRLAELSGHGIGTQLARLAERSTRTVTAAGLCGAALLIALAPSAQAVFSTLAVAGSADRVEPMTTALTWMAPGIVGLGLLLHAGRMLLALDRARACVLATASTWLVTAVAAVVAVHMLAPDGSDNAATLVALGAAHTIGMSVGGLVVVLVLRQVMPPGFARALARTLVVGGVAAVVGGLVGRVAVDAVLMVGDRRLLVAVMGALLGALIVALVMFLALRTFDRAILASVRGTHG